MSGLWVHLVIFSTCQVLAIINGFRSLVYGWPDEEAYTWWWGLQDFFHFGGGLVLLLAAMGFLCSVTTLFQRVPRCLTNALQDAGCPLVKIGAAAGLCNQTLGVEIFGLVCIDVSKAVGFFFVLLALVLNNLMAI